MDADNVINNWGRYINSGDLPSIVNLYSSDAILWGTFSNIIRNNSDLIEEYFRGLFQKNSLCVNFNSIHTRLYSDIYLYSGTYEITYKEIELVQFNSRFTFVVCKTKGDKYKIVEHHSSVIPD